MTTERDDTGFTLIEVLVSMTVIGAVMLVTTLAFVGTQSLTRFQGERQAATQLAADTIDELRSTPAEALQQRTDDAPLATAEAAVRTALVGLVGATDQLASGSHTRTVSDVPFAVRWHIGRCWVLADGADCTAANKLVPALKPLPMLRLAVAVSWAAKDCAASSNGRCVFTTSTLVDETAAGTDPVLPLPPSTPAPSPLPPAIWAAGLFSVEASVITINGAVHSNGEIRLTTSAGTITPRMEYVTRFQKDITAIMLSTPAPAKVSAGAPAPRDIAEYQPGGAKAGGATYKAVSCTAGSTWNYSAATVGSATVVYVPCNVAISYAAGIKALIIAEGTIEVTGAAMTIGDSTRAYATGLVSNSTATNAISIGGSATNVFGSVQALRGGVVIAGSLTTLRCGVIGDSVIIWANMATITVDADCVEP